ncbi:hypothetical protein QVD17_26572 [Tagetes erecta]|uniref:Uncharacterized protein n=1 Tax=Tagetes erecta TaxID=13708 RepID=A0AAD8KD66_TARER|nr:hypothetical protein QVD17_26572 [Tagetes erecta]
MLKLVLVSTISHATFPRFRSTFTCKLQFILPFSLLKTLNRNHSLWIYSYYASIIIIVDLQVSKSPLIFSLLDFYLLFTCCINPSLR